MSSNKALQYLDKAMSTVGQFATGKQQGEDLPVQQLIQQVSEFGPDQALTLAMVLARQSLFNELVRDEITGMEIANRYETITSAFTSIREDTGKQLKYIESGRMGLLPRITMKLRDMRKGTIPARFQKIKKVYIDVSRSLNEQLNRETRILDAYADYRFAMKDGETQAHQLLESATKVLEAAREAAVLAQKAVDDLPADADDQSRSALELTRDEKKRYFDGVDERYQIAKDLADQLRVAYHASEFVFARTKQISGVKKRLFDQGVAFFSTNEIVFTGQAAAFNSAQGLHEGTQTLNAMKDGMNKGLEELANMGGKVLEDGLRAGYGPGLKAQSIKALIDSVVDFQENSLKLIQELRKEATENADEVSRIAEDGKKRFSQLLTKSTQAA